MEPIDVKGTCSPYLFHSIHSNENRIFRQFVSQQCIFFSWSSKLFFIIAFLTYLCRILNLITSIISLCVRRTVCEKYSHILFFCVVTRRKKDDKKRRDISTLLNLTKKKHLFGTVNLNNKNFIIKLNKSFDFHKCSLFKRRYFLSSIDNRRMRVLLW